MAKQANVTLRPDRRGIVYRGKTIDGFPYVDSMEPDNQLRVARWANSLAPERLTREQRTLIAMQPARKVSARRREGIRQDEILHSALVQSLWRSLDTRAQELVLNPDEVLDKRYPLSTNELARLTGLSRRQVQYWSDRRLLPHWTNERGYRSFEAPAAIIAFGLRDRKQCERQFFADIGEQEHPLAAVRDTINIVGMRTLDLAEDADPQDVADTAQAFQIIAEGLNELLAEPARLKKPIASKSLSRT